MLTGAADGDGIGISRDIGGRVRLMTAAAESGIRTRSTTSGGSTTKVLVQTQTAGGASSCVSSTKLVNVN
jgi:hypothetical protein